MDSSDKICAMRAHGLGKTYTLYDSPLDRLKESLHPLRKRYHRNFRALDGICFEISVGDMVGIIGENGSGKSTLLKLIAGILTPTDGTIEVNGKVSALLELGAGFNPEMTGIENIYLTGTIMGYSRAEVNDKLDEIINFADIGQFLYQPVKTYSSGMYVRLAFSVATNVDPDILLVDEALSVGDMYFQAKSMQKMKSLMAENCTTLFVSHDTNAVKSLCRKCIYMEKGKIKSFGESGEVIDQYIQDQIERSGKRVSHGARTEKFPFPSEIVNLLAQKDIDEFERCAAINRSGSNRVRVLHAGLIDPQEKIVRDMTFGEDIILRIVWESKIQLDSLIIAFYVRDKNRIEVIGSNNLNAGVHICNIEPGRIYCTEFKLSNYLREGRYSIQLVLADQLAPTEYFDWIEYSILFQTFDSLGDKKWALYNPPIECLHNILPRQEHQIRSGRDNG